MLGVNVTLVETPVPVRVLEQPNASLRRHTVPLVVGIVDHLDNEEPPVLIEAEIDRISNEGLGRRQTR